MAHFLELFAYLIRIKYERNVNNALLSKVYGANAVFNNIAEACD